MKLKLAGKDLSL